MGAALLLALAVAAGGRFERVNSRTEQGRSDRGFMSSSGALFEFAPVSGAGMGAACACAAVTGAKGETLTFSRASAGSCIKASTTTLSSGDMVICSSGQPRVMPGGDGTGGLGLLVESAGTNVVTRSEELDDAAWADYTAGGASAPSIVPDVDYSPTATVTADWLQIPATTAAQSSGRSIAVLTAAAYSVQVYVAGGSSDIDLCVETAAGATCTTCGYDAAWRPCKLQNVTSVAGGRVFVGNLSSLNGGTARSAVDVLVWGVDAKLGAVVTSYVATAGSAVVRAGDEAYVDLGTAFFSTPGSVSAAATVAATAPTLTSTGPIAITVSSPSDTSGTGALWMYSGGSAGFLRCYYGGTATGFVSAGAGTSRGWCSAVAGTSLSGQFAGVAMSAAGAPTVSGTPRYLTIGQTPLGAAYVWTGIYKQICVDPDPTRCR